MIPTPEQVIEIFLPAVADIRTALRKGIAYADTVQPDAAERDPWFWSHSARWTARNHLAQCEDREWDMPCGIPNCGIHVRAGGLHVARVVRSLSGSTPHPGPNRHRRKAWTNQGQLFLA